MDFRLEPIRRAHLDLPEVRTSELSEIGLIVSAGSSRDWKPLSRVGMLDGKRGEIM
jgi:hypothetical protein